MEGPLGSGDKSLEWSPSLSGTHFKNKNNAGFGVRLRSQFRSASSVQLFRP